MPAATVNSWGAAIMTSAAAALALFLGAIPKVLGFLVILVIGWIIASAIAKVVAGLLRAVNFNDLARRSGFSGFVQQMGLHTDAAGALALIALWFVRLVVLVVAFDALGLPAVSQVLGQLLLFLPNLVVAMVVLVIAGLAANALSSLVRGSAASAGLGNPDLLATIARVAVWVFGIVIAVNQIGIASTLVNTLFMGFVAALALGLGLAFGLGGRDTAAEIVRGWYTRGHAAAPRVADAGRAAQAQARQMAEPHTPPTPPMTTRAAPSDRV
jgi:hypothetical protein